VIIVLDRDGVINEESSDYIKSPDEWHAIAGSLEAIAKLNQAGFNVVVATNQSGVGRGLYSEAMLTRIHQKMQDEMAAVGAHVDAIYYCPHHPDEDCLCRKPKPGLLKDIAADFGVSAGDMIFVGDSQRDLEAAMAFGVKPVLVLTGRGRRTRQKMSLDVDVYDNLSEFVAGFLCGDG